MEIAHNATVTLTCQCNDSISSFPVWYMNKKPVVSAQGYRTKVDPNTQDLIGILELDGNESYGALSLSCSVWNQITFTMRLVIKGLQKYMTVDLEL